MKSSLKFAVTFSLLAGMLFLGACAKKKVVAKTPPPPPPAAPTATLTASQPSIEKGQSVTLSWNTENASEINIDGLGTVAASGSQQVSPADSTTYHLMAKGAGGSAEASARVTVTAPPAPVAQAGPSIQELFAQNVKDIYFDYDKYDIRSSDQSIAEADAKFLAEHPDLKVVIEGHCDERGSEEYNLALGDNRANATKQLLDKLGITSDRLKVISYGKEKPFCTDNTDACYQMNRRAHFAIAE
ncbi:MAG TPA: peptidoglycan-associated lipoprotein Pal [Terriglobales bacterium]|nr:peptidoglycan-associated lipoprotein Pal [Terriglobales bacterium]